MQAVSLGIERDLVVARELVRQRLELGGRADPAGRGNGGYGVRSRIACSMRWNRRRSGSRASSWVMT
jgi:hypothetical protein